MGRSKQVFVSSPVYSVVPLFLRLFIDKSSLLSRSGHRWLGLQRADPAIGDSSLPLDLPSTPVMTYP